jgi:hypothetical protein
MAANSTLHRISYNTPVNRYHRDEFRLPELEQVLRDFKSKTPQEAIYLEIHRDVEIRFL